MHNTPTQVRAGRPSPGTARLPALPWLLLLLLLALQWPAVAQTTKRLYLVGNSVTDAINYDGLDALAESRGNTHIWGRQMIPGAPLSWLWEHPNEGFQNEEFGYPTTAFRNFTWDAISLQPFDRSIDGADGDLAMVRNYVDLAKGKSPDVQFYIYMRWPRTPNDKAHTDPSLTADTWSDIWNTPYNGGWASQENKDFFEDLLLATRTGVTINKPLLIVPVGEVFNQLNTKMKNGQVPGYSKIWQVYSDGIHMNNVGSFIAATTYYATLYKDDPRGMAVPSQYGGIGGNLASIIQQTVWDVVTTYQYSGVSGTTVAVTGVSVAPATLSLTAGQTGTLTATVSPADATNKGVSWSSSNTTVATVDAAGTVTARAAGTATITATTADGAKTASGSVTVTAASASAGLNYQFYTGTWSVLPDFGTLTAAKTGTVANFDLSPRTQNDNFAFRFTGFLTVAQAGSYTFFTTSDDGSKMFVNGTQVVDNDGLHGATERSGTITLAAGRHAIEVTMFERGGGEVLEVRWQGPGVSKQLIPASALSANNVVAVTGVSVAPTTASIMIGKTQQLTATVAPADATNKNAAWSSSNTAVASVSASGLVTALAAGTATITVRTDDGARTATSAITVFANSKPVARITATPSSGAAPLAVSFNASTSTDPDAGDFILGYEWDFGDGSARSNANAPSRTYTTAGTYTVTLRVMDNNNLYSDPVTTSIVVSGGGGTPTSGTLAQWDFAGKGGQTTVAASAKSADVTSASTAFGAGLRVDNYLGNGFVGAEQTGADQAAALAGNDYISFTLKPVAGKSLTITKVELRPVSQNVSRSFALFSSVDGFTAGKQLGSFTSASNEGAPLNSVSVANHANLTADVEFRLYIYGGSNRYESAGMGNRTGTGSGTYDLAVIGTTSGGTTPPPTTIAVTGVSAAPATASLAVGGTQQLTATVAPADATNKNVAWSSSNTAVASVSASGLVTALAAGTATITVTTADGAKTATSAITVTGGTAGSETRPAGSTGTGFFTKNGKIYDANGNEFIPRGVNGAVFWQDETCAKNSIAEVAKTKANSLRLVSVIPAKNGWSWSSRVANQRAIVQSSVANKIVPMLEFHDATCGSAYENDPEGKDLKSIVDYWVTPEVVQLCKDYERELIVNVANEWGDETVAWRDAYKTALTRMRAAGIKNMIVIDAGGNCGQNPEALRTWAAEIMAHDPQKNVAFSIHMYGFWTTADKTKASWQYSVETELQAIKNAGIPIMVGEFGWETSPDVAYNPRLLLQKCVDLGLGWFFWSWYDQPDRTFFNVINDHCTGYRTDADLTAAGAFVVNDANLGLKRRAVMATIFSGTTPPPVADTQAPTVPAGLGATAISQTGFTLNWTASTDNTGVSGYEVYRNGTLAASPTGTSATLSGLTAGTAYSMTVRAKDAAGNVSAASSALSVATLNATTPPPTGTTPKLPIGMNLSSMSYYGVTLAFTDVMTTASDMMSFVEGGAWNSEQINNIPRDTSGYPTQIPYNVGGGSQLVRFLINKHYTGRYVVLYDGVGTLRVGGIPNSVSAGKLYLDLDGQGGDGWLEIISSQAGNHLRNIRILPEQYANGSAYPRFQPKYLDMLRPFHAYRFMDWMHTNGSTQKNWSDRIKRSYYSQGTGRGVAIEYAVELCNELNADAWFCVPHQASDEYIRNMARLIRDRLKPSLKVYIEYSNEIWNWQFEQASYVLNNAPGAVDSYVINDLRAINPSPADHPEKDAYMMARVFRLFKGEFAGANASRLVKVGAVQHGWYDNTGRVLEYLKVNNQQCDLVSPGGYFNFEEPDHNGFLQRCTSVTAEEVLQAVENIYDETSGLWTQKNAEYAKQYGVGYAVYEGGQHMQPWMQGDWCYNEAVWAAQIHPKMYDLYMRNFRKHIEPDVNCSIFMAFADIGARKSKYGSWGHLESLNQVGGTYADAPKYKALLDANTPKTGGRVPGGVISTAQGVTLFPNPAQAEVYVGGISSPATVELVNPLGRVVYRRTQVDITTALPLTGLSSGIYLLRVSEPGKPTVTRKLVKN